MNKPIMLSANSTEELFQAAKLLLEEEKSKHNECLVFTYLHEMIEELKLSTEEASVIKNFLSKCSIFDDCKVLDKNNLD